MHLIRWRWNVLHIHIAVNIVVLLTCNVADDALQFFILLKAYRPLIGGNAIYIYVFALRPKGVPSAAQKQYNHTCFAENGRCALNAGRDYVLIT